MTASMEERRSNAPVDEEKGVSRTTAQEDEAEDEFPPFQKVVLIMLAVYLSMFLVALVSILGFKYHL